MRREVFAGWLGWILATFAALTPAQQIVPTGTPSPDDAARPGLAYRNLLADVRASEPAQQRQLVERWLQTKPRAPVNLADGWTAFVYHGPARDVGVVGDMTQWADALPLARLGETDLWFREARFDPAGRLDYLLLVEGERRLDPLNPATSPGLEPGSRQSVWTDPKHRSPDFLAALPPKQPGTDKTFALEGRRVFVHLPAAYDREPASRFPVVYFHGGDLYRDAMGAGEILDVLAERGDIEPSIAVMIQPAAPETDFALSADYAAWVGGRLVPEIDRAFRTRPDRESRLSMGASLGGLAAVHVALERPDLFAKVALQSALAGVQQGEVIRRLREALLRPDLSFHVEVGSLEGGDGPRAALDANRRLRTALASRNYPLFYAERPAGHSPGFWRERLPEALRRFFPPQKKPRDVVEIFNPAKPR
jgi:enterochelin esterase-like enzyme